MTVTFKKLLTDCLVALGDTQGATWSRVNVIWPWCIEATQAFPILRPMFYDCTVPILLTHPNIIDMPVDFRQMISLEYPVGQTPPAYNIRKNRLDPNFTNDIGYFDVDHNYIDGTGYFLYMSKAPPQGVHLYVEYLATHDVAMADDDNHLLSVPDEYETILITSVMCRAYRQRLSVMMVDPTAHTNVINQMTEMVQHVEELFQKQVRNAQHQLTNAIVSPRMGSDKYDRVY
jgi:hypothetical protein